MKHLVSFRPPLPGGALWLCLLVLFAAAPSLRAAPLAEGDFKQWSLLAIQDEGRRKPMDTFARESLLRLTGGSMGVAVYRDRADHVWHPNELLLSILVSDPHQRDWKEEPLVLVNYRPLVEQLGLSPARKRFSFNELSNLPKLQEIIRGIHTLRSRTSDAQLSREQQEAENVGSRLTLLSRLLTGEALLVAPPPARGTPPAAAGAGTFRPAAADAPGTPARGAWLVPPDASAAYGETAFKPVVGSLQETIGAYEEGNVFKFNSAAHALRDGLRSLNPGTYPPEDALSNERNYNHLGAFPRASLLYGLGFLLLLAGGRATSGLRRGLRLTGVATGLAGLALHATGITLRCIVAGRPPVTNMYESMIWVAFVVATLGFVFYFVYRGATTYLLAALPVGCLVLLLVQQIPVAVPGSIEPLQPVLRDNFWLATHVLTETAAYGAFALAMGFGHILLGRYVLDPLAARRDHVLHHWLYRVLQLGVLLLAVGTILGAVWANYSWGRYWGWDPKETWAFITFLCYIVAIHGRIAGYWGQFGLAVASVACFGAVVMAWYGVNFWLGKGLHSYGRGVGGEGYVAGLLALDAAFLAFACYRQATARGPVPVAETEPLKQTATRS